MGVPAALGDGQGQGAFQQAVGGPNGHGPNGNGPPGQQGTDGNAALRGGDGPGQWNDQGRWGHGLGQGFGQGPPPGGNPAGLGAAVAQSVTATVQRTAPSAFVNGDGQGPHGGAAQPGPSGGPAPPQAALAPPPPEGSNGRAHGHNGGPPGQIGRTFATEGQGGSAVHVPPGQLRKLAAATSGVPVDAESIVRAASAAVPGRPAPEPTGAPGATAAQASPSQPSAAPASAAPAGPATGATRVVAPSSVDLDLTKPPGPSAVSRSLIPRPKGHSSVHVPSRRGSKAHSHIGALAITPTAGAGALAAGLGVRARSAGTPIVNTPLALGTTGIVTRQTHHSAPIARAGLQQVHLHLSVPGLGFLASAPFSTIVDVIPTGVWIALGVAVALAALAGAVAFRSSRRARRSAGTIAAVTAAALTDPLTGLLNRRGFMEASERELDRARRYDHPLALAFVDIRGLKAVNDTEGHLAGDRVLEQVSMLLGESARTNDLVGRIGGDELAVLLAEQSADGAEAMIERVRAQIPASRASLGLVTPWDVTIGTAAFPEDGNTFQQLLDSADRRLYKQRGIDLAR